MMESMIGFGILLVLIFLRIPIAFAMAGVGVVGFAALMDFNFAAALSISARRLLDTAQDYSLSVIPLFILMGNLVSRSGLSGELFQASHALVGHRKGGMAMAAITACGGFSAICGSSLATAATMSRVAIPPMRKYGYADSLATAAIAAGGTLGILIPPSVALIIYGVLTEQSIRDLFAAGFVPGLLGILLYLGAVRYVVWRNPKAGPPGDAMSRAEKWQAFKGVGGILSLFTLVMGGIYLGIFTPTEAAGIGAAGALGIALKRRSLSMKDLLEVLTETVRTSAMLFCVVIGALIFSNFINRAGLPEHLVEMITQFSVSPMTVLLMIIAIYLVLGAVFESMSMMLLTVPVFFPVIHSLGLDPIWFGIIVVVATEISLITPPVGMNVFVLSGMLKDVNSSTVFRGVIPFWCADVIRLGLLILLPALTLWLPNLLYR
ncbi:C4-dicarboxylate ABC transporter permease [Zobellella denitrificans]|jgi:tripartite ATP-independent transporter DctM subunit|uniref:TRAP transporter large permease protein n=2 Tax=Zobellella denitrificans TaxID=347534 RepID=A0A231MYX3_9GAMM|nr:C4-dicarboxylate ABC transporter permease [Zobellella denitrificans]OXS15195.1 C4-dicarboxylate ABC transporter permease [Zobellella denitrificans]